MNDQASSGIFDSVPCELRLDVVLSNQVSLILRAQLRHRVTNRSTPGSEEQTVRHSRAALSMFVLLVGFLVQPAGLGSIRADTLPLVRDVEFQPLSAQARRVVDALDMLGNPCPGRTGK